MKRLLLYILVSCALTAPAQQTATIRAASRPALIPLPQEWQEQPGRPFDWTSCKNIIATDSSLYPQARRLQQHIGQAGGQAVIQVRYPHKTDGGIVLQLRPSAADSELQQEAYHLSVTTRRVTLSAPTPHGIFNGLQTWYQLAASGNGVRPCTIRDRPAFAWRGYMIDVGRNYVSLPLLMEQIDVMARYKLNIFHLHLTEDIAWRLASKQYPQLTAAGNMVRNPGKYYSEADMKALIAYCRERFITLVPEIDMPGHSAAFARAMHTTMQSDTGLAIVKNILQEFCTTYDLPYVHIGADEVKITNPAFIPAVTAVLEGHGRQVIGWQPGGHFNTRTIRQLWMDDAAHNSNSGATRFIDSRHLYLNHMDPLEAVVTLYNRQIGNRPAGDAAMLGGTLCLWHDRKVATEMDLLRMNPVYPGIIAFSERIWKGGGIAGWIANIDDGDSAGFVAFENRLLRHKALYFPGKPFPYVAQAGLQWKLFGPYDNEGHTERAFEPESAGWSPETATAARTISGGTVVLRHWWAPLIKGAIGQPTPNSTWYAATTIWSDRDTVAGFWIGFNNLSRSPATDSPPRGGWDDKGSAVWVNGQTIAPPQWQQSGEQGHAEVPLVDEGYEYRSPTMIPLKKGWNEVLVKAPIGNFKGKDWQNPVKWMLTFCRVDE